VGGVVAALGEARLELQPLMGVDGVSGAETIDHFCETLQHVCTRHALDMGRCVMLMMRGAHRSAALRELDDADDGDASGEARRAQQAMQSLASLRDDEVGSDILLLADVGSSMKDAAAAAREVRTARTEWERVCEDLTARQRLRHSSREEDDAVAAHDAVLDAVAAQVDQTQRTLSLPRGGQDAPPSTPRGSILGKAKKVVRRRSKLYFLRDRVSSLSFPRPTRLPKKA
jgi:hypothetical protein